MKKRSYELIEHTADIAIRVKGKDLKELFKKAALAMFDLCAERIHKTTTSKRKEFLIRLKAVNVEELFVNWLNELLSLSAVKLKVFCDFKFKTLTQECLEAIATGCDIDGYKIHTEIKAATYHELSVKKTRAGWVAQVIFDV